MSKDIFTKHRFTWLEGVMADPQVGPADFAIAFAISSFTNRESGDAWPTQETIAKKVRMTERGVRKIIDKLVSTGHISKVAGQGWRQPNVYRLVAGKVKDGGTVVPPIKPNDRNHGSSHMTGTAVPPINENGRNQEALWEEPESILGGTPVPVELIDELIDEPIEEIDSLHVYKKPSIPDKELDKEFRGWYLQYPKRVGSRAAEKAYRAVREKKQATANELLQGVMRYAAEREAEPDPVQRQKYTAHPATWLNQHRWKDDLTQTTNRVSAKSSTSSRGSYLDLAIRHANSLERQS
jgi:hypothetical protein